MTLVEAKAAAKHGVPIQICGVTAKRLFGKFRYQHIARVCLQFDKAGEAYYTAELVDSVKSVLTCGIEDVELADDVSERVREAFEKATATEEIDYETDII